MIIAKCVTEGKKTRYTFDNVTIGKKYLCIISAKSTYTATGLAGWSGSNGNYSVISGVESCQLVISQQNIINGNYRGFTLLEVIPSDTRVELYLDPALNSANANITYFIGQPFGLMYKNDIL